MVQVVIAAVRSSATSHKPIIIGTVNSVIIFFNNFKNIDFSALGEKIFFI